MQLIEPILTRFFSAHPSLQPLSSPAAGIVAYAADSAVESAQTAVECLPLLDPQTQQARRVLHDLQLD